MPLLQLLKVDLAVGGPKLLDGVDFTIDPRERVCIVGRNGMGKTTLMRLIAGEIRADDGEVRVSDGVRVAKLDQEVPRGLDGDVFDVVAAALGDKSARAEEPPPGTEPEHRRELTNVERKVLTKLLSIFTEGMATAWAPVIAFKPEIARFESDPRLAVIAPNNDPGSQDIFAVLERLPKERFRLLPSMRFAHFSELMKNAACMVGNSSAGVREAPFLGLPSLDIGTRQTRRSDAPSIRTADAGDRAAIAVFRAA